VNIFQAIIYGIVQGLTEFLPISSSGHLYLVPTLLKWEDAGAGFTAVIQLGTLLAVFIYFWKDISTMFRAWLRSFVDAEVRVSQEAKKAWGVFFGTIPIIIAGLLFKDAIESTLRSPWIVASTLVGFGLLMGAAESLGSRQRGIDELRMRDGIYMGLWQCLALIPGSSRSGCTMTGGLFSGMDRGAAARYSFLLSIPSVLASGLYKLYDERSSLLEEGLAATAVGTVVSFLVGYAAIAWLMRFIQNRSLWPFVWYRVALGLVIAVLASTGFFAVQAGG
jgi:undecaprenyl-diphosphatase